MAMLLATVDELAAVDSVASARAWAGVSDIAWNAIQEQVGTITSLRVVAILPAHQIKSAAESASKMVRCSHWLLQRGERVHTGLLSSYGC